MKIVLISPSRSHLDAMGAALETHGHAVLRLDGGKSRMRDIAEQEAPDLMLVDGMCCDIEELVHVEHVTTHHPGTAVILLCSTHTPEFLINSMRAGVREVLPSPAAPAALQAAVGRVAAKLAGATGRRQGRILAFMPCKGGAGATFLATNLGAQLAENSTVLLMDLNLQFGDALSFVHDARPVSTLADVAHGIDRLDASLLAASTVRAGPNYSILPAPEDLAHAMEVKPEHVDAVLNVAVANYDFVLLDLARLMDTITIKALDRAARIYAVMQASLPDVRNAARLVAAFRSLGYGGDKAEFVINRFEKGREIGTEQVRRALGDVRLSTIPNAWREVSSSINHGEPLARTGRSNAVARQLAELAQALNPPQEEGRGGLFGRLFRKA